jgi:hypothetical protein
MARGEVTGRKLGADRELPPPIPILALSIPQFCEAHNISVGMYFKLRKQGHGPREMKCGTRTLVTFEAAVDWRREREAASVAEAKVKAAKSAGLVREANV